MNFTFKPALVFSVILILLNSLYADSIFLKSGKIIEGEIKKNIDPRGDIVITPKGKPEQIIKKETILRIKNDDEYKKEKEINLGINGTIDGFIVDQDEEAIYVRKAINSPEENRIPRSRIKNISDPSKKGRLRDEELAKKKENWYFTGLPWVIYNTENSMIFGGRISFYDNGPKDGEFFNRSPYDLQVFLHALVSLGGYQQYRLNLDKFNVLGSNFRIFTYFEFRYNTNANYFGSGEKVTSTPLTDVYGNTYSTFRDYELGFVNAGDMSEAKYNKFTYLSPRYSFNSSAKFAKYFEFLAGFLVSWYQIQPWDGRAFEYNFKGYTAKNYSLLTKEKPLGFNGGWNNYVRLGIAFDTRDYEPDPNLGMYFDYNLEAAGRMIGSDYEYFRHTLGLRFYTPLIWNPLILAVRLGYTTASNGIPFFEMSYFPFMIDRADGLESSSLLKGYKFARFIGPTMTTFNLELRWKVWEFMLWNQRIGIKLIGSFDAKNVYNEPVEIFTNHRWEYYKLSYGGSLAIVWNLATVMRIGVGFSPEDWSISMLFGQSF